MCVCVYICIYNGYIDTMDTHTHTHTHTHTYAMAPHFSTLAGKSHGRRSQAVVHGVMKSQND